LDAFPISSNGKVDRLALPGLEGTRSNSEEGFVSPRNYVEGQLATIWGRVLGIHAVGVKDNFFELGGHSLLAVRVISEIDKVFHKRVPLAAFFQVPTIEQFAKLFSDEVRLAPWSSLVPLQTKGAKPPFFWVHGEASDIYLPRFLDSDQPLYGFIHQSED